MHYDILLGQPGPYGVAGGEEPERPNATRTKHAAARPAANTPQGERWAPGSQVGRYRILRRLGEGTFGMTVLARREGPRASRFQKLVALKIMKPEHARDREFATRMLDEAKLQAALRHDQLVDVYDFHIIDQDLVLEMEYVEGLTLAQYLRTFVGGRVPERVAIYVTARILRGLAWMHEACDEEQRALKLVHRDIKPSNVFLSRSGAIKLGDFGLIRGRGRHYETSVAPDARVIGTPRYMAAEQCEGGPIDGRADVYAVGVMLYEVLTGGRHPAGHHTAACELDAIRGTMSEARTPIRNLVPSLSPQLGELVDAMVARRPCGRPTASDALSALLDVTSSNFAREEQALQASVAFALRCMRAGSAAGDTPTCADEPTEFFHNPPAEDTMTAPHAGTNLSQHAQVASMEVATRTQVRPARPCVKSRNLLVALGGSLAVFVLVALIAVIRHL